MTVMNPTPAQIVEAPLGAPTLCSPEESQSRLDLCVPCENFFIDEDQHTKCQGCGCNISILTTIKDKSCPLGKW